ncbi:MAG: sulfatase-like hydrolase/transferase [Acidobacteriota bacterium]
MRLFDARRTMLALCALLLSAFSLRGAVPPQPPEDPPRNVLLVVIDDLGDDYLESYRTSLTPRIDRIAETGIRFTNAWSNPLCSPTRATLMTGRYGFRTGVVRNANLTELGNEELTIPEALSTYSRPGFPGYRSAAFGKWHLTRNTERTRCDVGPYAQGFERYAGSYGNLACARFQEPTHGFMLSVCGHNEDHWNFERTICDDSTCGAGGASACTLIDPTDPDGTNQTELDFVAQRDTNYLDPSFHSTEYTTTQALDWIEQVDATGAPWFAYVAYNADHAPWQPAPPEVGAIPCGTNADALDCRRQYYEEMMAHLDARIGDLTAEILEPEGSLYDDTALIVVGDNGTPKPIDAPDDAYERLWKGTLYEGGIHVPLIISTPETRSSGTLYMESPALANTTDVYATVLELATGEPLETFRAPESPRHTVSLVPVIADPQGEVRDFAYAERDTGENANGAIRDDTFKLLLLADSPPEFYDVSDHQETADLLPIDAQSPAGAIASFTELCGTLAELAPARWDLNGDAIADRCCDPSVNDIDGDADGVPDLCDICLTGENQDLDGDGFPEGCDTCPGLFNPSQLPDLDGDGFPESCDTCPGVYNPDQSTEGCFALK